MVLSNNCILIKEALSLFLQIEPGKIGLMNFSKDNRVLLFWMSVVKCHS